ncbi:MAG: hypothetical protein RLZ81_808 [Pseudomonadota bacterium]|jgi:uncharacterized protein YcbX
MQGDSLPNWDVTGLISRLFVYPVKSCAGVALTEAILSPTGLAMDRSWMLVDGQGQFVTQREQPRMALVTPEVAGQRVTLRAPGMPPLPLGDGAPAQPIEVNIWGETVLALDAGEPAAQWFTRFLVPGAASQRQTGYAGFRLVRFDPACRRLSNQRWTGGRQALNQFSDGYPVLVLGEASLAAFNQRLHGAGHGSVGMERFRPNVVLAGLEPHDEDRLDSLRIDTSPNAVVFKLVKPCPRCPIPNIDPATAQSSPHVSDTLQSYRQDPRVDGAVTFGMNAIALEGVGATLRVGQAVRANFDFG